MRELASDSMQVREGAASALGRRLAALELEGRSGELARELEVLRGLLRSDAMEIEVRTRLQDVLAPFEGGHCLWTLDGDMAPPGPVQWAHAVRGTFVCAGHSGGDRSGWAAAYDGATGKRLWKADLPGLVAQCVPWADGVAAAGFFLDRPEGWLRLIDPANGATLRAWDGFPGRVSVVESRYRDLLIGGLEPQGGGSWVALVWRDREKPVWVSRDLPGPVIAVRGAGEAVFAGGSRLKPEGSRIGAFGWVSCHALSDGRELWRRTEVPGRVESLRPIDGDVLAAGSNLATEEAAVGFKGHLIKMFGWMGRYSAGAEKPVWERTSQGSPEDFPGGGLRIAVLPEGVLAGGFSGKDAMGHAGWVGLFKGQTGATVRSPLAEFRDRLLTLSASDAFVAVGGTLGKRRGYLALFRREPGAPPQKGWEVETPHPIDRIQIDSSGDLLVASGFTSMGQERWIVVGAYETATGRALWEKVGTDFPGPFLDAVCAGPSRVLAAGHQHLTEGGEAWLVCHRLRAAGLEKGEGGRIHD